MRWKSLFLHIKTRTQNVSVENKRLTLHNFHPVPGLFLSSLPEILIRRALVCFIILEWRLTGRIKHGDKQLNQTICGKTLKLSRVILGYYHVMSLSYFHPVICQCVSSVWLKSWYIIKTSLRHLTLCAPLRKLYTNDFFGLFNATAHWTSNSVTTLWGILPQYC